MKITALETFHLGYDMPYSLTFARGEYQRREALLVKIHTDTDLVGWGEAAMWGGPHIVSATVIEKEIAPLIVGEDPLRPEYLWEKVYQNTYYHGRKGILLSCLSGVDIALWDIVGKSMEQPLWRIFGGFGQPLTTYASSGYYRHNYSLSDFAADIEFARKEGHVGYKIKIGNIARTVHRGTITTTPLEVTIEEDLKRITVARDAVSPGGELMVDANTSFDTRTAMLYSDAMENLDVRWFEEPVQPENINGCAELARRSRVPIAGFETETNKHSFAALIDAGAIDIVQPDIVQVGGFTEALKIAHYAQIKHLLFTSKIYSTAVSMAACAQLLFALPNANYFEVDQAPLPWRDGIVKTPAVIRDGGHVTPSPLPGIGVDIDEEALKPWLISPDRK